MSDFPISHVLVARLRMVWWPTHVHGWTLDRVMAAAPVPMFMSNEDRCDLEEPGDLGRYDLGRVRYFLDVLRAGGEVDAITIDTEWAHCSTPIAYNPFVYDGHHRYVASVLAERQTIAASCGGLVEQIDWLTGETDRPPPSIVLDDEP